MKKLGITILFVLFSLILTACGSDTVDNEGDSGNNVNLKFGTTSSTSGPFSYLVALANSMKEGSDGKIVVDVVETAASLDNIRLMKRGDVDFGVVTTDAQYDAYHGEGVFADGEPYEELRMFLPFSPFGIAIIVRADAGIESVYDLDGEKFNAGFAGTSTSETIKAIFRTLGIEPDYVEANLDDAMEKVKNKEIVGLAKSTSIGTPDASITSLNTLIDINVLGFSEEDAAKIESEFPKYDRFEIPPNIYKNQSEPLHVFGHVGSVAVPTTLSEDLVYEMFKATVENREMQEEAYFLLKNHDYFEMIAEYTPIPLHPGVIRYLEENGKEYPEF